MNMKAVKLITSLQAELTSWTRRPKSASILKYLNSLKAMLKHNMQLANRKKP